jgi:serine protease Do
MAQPVSASPESFSVPDVAERSVQGVVNISTTKKIDERFGRDPLRRWFQGQGRRRAPAAHSLGSGVLIRENGLILTNHHVIAGADTIKVNFADGREFSAKLVGQDPKSDVAVIRLEHPPQDLTPIKLGDSDALRLGETVLAIGNPFGLGHTVTMGIVSAKGRANLDITDYENFIQTDAAINPGNSGGALVNAKGELVGINTAIYSRSGGYQGIGFAIPSKMASRIMDSLVDKGRVDWGYLGVGIQPLGNKLSKRFNLKTAQSGVLINYVGRDTPAQQSGLLVGDIILKLDGEVMKTPDGLRNVVAMKGAGTQVSLDLWRSGRAKTIQLKLGLLPDPTKVSLNRAKPSGIKPINRFGMRVIELNAKLRDNLRLDDSISGVVVEYIVPQGRSHRAGLRPGDVIVRVNRQSVDTVEDFETMMSESAEELLLRIRRGPARLFVILLRL